MIKNEYYVHPSAVIDKNVTIGDNTKIWHFSHIQFGAQIGHLCTLGQNVYVGEGVSIGNHVKIQNNVSVYQGVTLEDYVFCGPSVVFTNDINPRSKFPKNQVYINTIIKEGCTIGANSTIVCGNTLGSWSLIGAGSVVTKNVRNHSVVVGNPARHIGWICECGNKLNESLECETCQRKYHETSKGLTQVKV